MRKISIAVALMMAIAGSAFAQANLLTNGTFETATSEWDWTGTGWNNWGEAWNQSWSAHTGVRGAYFGSWGGTGGGLWQDVAATTKGEYTASIWILMESGFNPTNVSLKLEWYAADHGTPVQDEVVAEWTGLPKDGLWHQIFVTGVATADAMAYVRPVISSDWNAPNPGGSAVFLDDVELYMGSYTGIPTTINGSFDAGLPDSFRGCSWAAVTEGHWGRSGWSARTGSNGVFISGWDTYTVVETNGAIVTTNTFAYTNNNNILSQPLYKGTGTYTFSVWMSREENLALTNSEIRIEWYDLTCSNKVQADSVTNFTVPGDNTWRKYYVTGTCTNENLHEIRPVIQVGWDCITNDLPGRAGRIDDAYLLEGENDRILKDWAYYNDSDYNPLVEAVPGGGAQGAFLQVNYAMQTNTIYVLADSPTVARYAGEGGEVSMRVSYQRPDGEWSNIFESMTFDSTVEISAASPFHGQPVSGVSTVDVWKYEFAQPHDPAGAFYTNLIRVYYAPFMRATNEFGETDYTYLLFKNGTVVNDLGQEFGPSPTDSDYFYDNYKAPTWAAFTNGGFENPEPGTNNLADTGWFAWGGASREQFAAKSGVWGGFFPSWDPGAAMIWQDVATTGGTYAYEMYIQIQAGAHPTNLALRMEWYNQAGVLVQVNEESLDDVPRTNVWNKVRVLGGCYEADLDYVRLTLAGEYADGTEEYNEAIMFDEANFYKLSETLQNPGFEEGFQTSIPWWFWDATDYGLVEIHEWAAYTGSNGLAFHGYVTNMPEYGVSMMQPLAAITGSYVFSTWISLEADMLLTNCQLKLEWLDGEGAKVQADTVETLTMPTSDETWYQYSVTGTCLSADLLIVQPVLLGQWDENPTGVRRAMKIDDMDLIYTNFAAGETTDGIPNSWLTLYGLGLTNGVGAGDDDSDGSVNEDEYAADSNPTDPSSAFSNVVQMVRSSDSAMLYTAWSTNSRTYFITFKTDLMDGGPWLPYGVEVQGTGDPVALTVTNDLEKRFYRIGVKP